MDKKISFDTSKYQTIEYLMEKYQLKRWIIYRFRKAGAFKCISTGIAPKSGGGFLIDLESFKSWLKAYKTIYPERVPIDVDIVDIDVPVDYESK